MLTIQNRCWWKEKKNPTKCTRAGKKGRKRNSYLSDVAAKETRSTSAGKRHHIHYSDRGKHTLSPEPFQILLRPTQQSCTSRFLTEGNPDVIHITLWNSAAAMPAPSLLVSTQQMKKCSKSRGLCCTMRICLTVYCSTHTHGRMLSLLRVQKREHQKHHFSLIGFRWSVGFWMKLEKGFYSYWPLSAVLPASIHWMFYQCSSSSEELKWNFWNSWSRREHTQACVWLETP